MSAYELERQRNIARNMEMLSSLGLQTAPKLPPPSTMRTDNKKRSETSRRRSKSAGSAASGMLPVRSSQRIKRMAPDAASVALALQLAEELSDDDSHEISDAESLPAREAIPHFRTQNYDSMLLPSNISAPFSLASNHVTILDLGHIVTAPELCHLYWSAPTSMFRHLYPVGFKSTKWHFDREWTMTISESQIGPVFTVQATTGGPVYQGRSATKPWSDICAALAHQ
eukprot:jgi/Hompol1/2842/HPOL_006189-RA